MSGVSDLTNSSLPKQQQLHHLSIPTVRVRDYKYLKFQNSLSFFYVGVTKKNNLREQLEKRNSVFGLVFSEVLDTTVGVAWQSSL